VKLLEPTLKHVVTARPKDQTHHLCGDKAYVGAAAEKTMRKQNYIPHVPSRGEETKVQKQKARRRSRRWVVERTNSWLNRFRKVLVRFEKSEESYEGLLELVCALIAFRQCIVIYG